MNYFLFLIFGVLPSLMWLAFYLRRDKHPEPNRMVVFIFLLGAASTIPAIFLELGIERLLSQGFFSPTTSALLYTFFGVALVEELLKYGVIRWKVYSSPLFDEPIDLPLYMIIAALGFAAFENILILSGLGPASPPGDILLLSIFRFVGATFLHALVSGMFGYFLVLSLFGRRYRPLFFLVGLFLATSLHGLFNLLIIEVESSQRILFPGAILIGLAIFVSLALTRLSRMQFQKSQAQSTRN